MPAKSKAQQRYLGMVHAVQTGKLSPDSVSKSIRETAKTMDKQDAGDFARTSHKDLPEHVKAALLKEARTILASLGQSR